jgi:hypothetical protein
VPRARQVVGQDRGALRGVLDPGPGERGQKCEGPETAERMSRQRGDLGAVGQVPRKVETVAEGDRLEAGDVLGQRLAKGGAAVCVNRPMFKVESLSMGQRAPWAGCVGAVVGWVRRCGRRPGDRLAPGSQWRFGPESSESARRPQPPLRSLSKWRKKRLFGFDRPVSMARLAREPCRRGRRNESSDPSL